MQSSIFVALVILAVSTTQSVHGASLKAPCPDFDCGPNGKRVDGMGVDDNGCPIIACVDKCPPYMIRCPPGMRVVEVGKDENGCPQKECMACPKLVCPPGGVPAGAGVDAFGCPRLSCVSACPPYAILCPDRMKEAEVGKDERGCPKKKCVPK